jgi:hypothetical protein
VQHLGYLEFGEIARVAHRTLDQPQIFVNNLAIRRATEELKVARDYEQVRRILTAAFGSNDFDAFELKLEMQPGEPYPFDAADPSARRNGHSFRWSKPALSQAALAKSTAGKSAVNSTQPDSPLWTIALDLLSSSNRRRGTLLVHRLYSRRDLHLDINLLTSAFPTALADALERTLAHSAQVIALPDQDTPLIAAQAG